MHATNNNRSPPPTTPQHTPPPPPHNNCVRNIGIHCYLLKLGQKIVLPVRSQIYKLQIIGFNSAKWDHYQSQLPLPKVQPRGKTVVTHKLDMNLLDWSFLLGVGNISRPLNTMLSFQGPYLHVFIHCLGFFYISKQTTHFLH